MELTQLEASRERLIVEIPDYVRLDDAVGQFAVKLAVEKLGDCEGFNVLGSLDQQILTDTVAIAIATGMQTMREALREVEPDFP